MAKEEWSLGQGFRSATQTDCPTDGQQAGEVAYKGTTLDTTPGSVDGRSGRKVGFKMGTTVNGLGPKGTQSVLS